MELADLTNKEKLGLITWSPLASGLLSGKYQKGVPQDSRFASPSMDWLKKVTLTEENLVRVDKFLLLSHELQLSPVQLAIAWCLRNKKISSVLLGVSRFEQLEDCLKSLDAIAKVTEETWFQIEEIFSGNLMRTTR